MSDRSLIIRTDASSQIGLGHFMRCLALAQAWQDRGGNACFVLDQCPLSLINRLHHEGFSRLPLTTDSPGSEMDARETIKAARRMEAQWIVVDGYQFSKKYINSLRSSGFKLLVIDDFANSNNGEADLVLNQNLHASNAEKNKGPNSLEPRSLLGPKFALLRREFINVEKPLKRRAVTSPNLLLTLGGADPDNITGKILDLLSSLATPITIRIISGSANPHLEVLRTKVANSPHHVKILSDVQDMPSLYAWADGIISAGGSTCWEWMLFGLPAAVIILAENQRLVAESLAAARYAVNLGWHHRLDDQEVIRNLNTFIQGLKLPPNPNNKLVDGYGAARVAAILEDGLWLRRAGSDDCQLYFDWVNEPLVRTNSLNSESISFESHVKWYRNHLGRPETRMYVGMLKEEPIGQVRFDQNVKGIWEVDFSVIPAQRGNGLGSSILQLAIAHQRQRGELPIAAKVKSQNFSSCKCFERLGFKRSILSKDEIVHYFLKE